VKAKNEAKNDLDEYAKDGGFDIEVIKITAKLGKNDQEFRSATKMEPSQLGLDEKNIEIVDSLYNNYKIYVSKSFVGQKFEHVMWAVIQHSDLNHQEYYLPIIHQAVIDQETTETTFKMLIDRVYTKKYGYQIFGSQGQIDLAPDEVLKKVKVEYGIK
jgi:hypothetical protein